MTKSPPVWLPRPPPLTKVQLPYLYFRNLQPPNFLLGIGCHGLPSNQSWASRTGSESGVRTQTSRRLNDSSFFPFRGLLSPACVPSFPRAPPICCLPAVHPKNIFTTEPHRDTEKKRQRSQKRKIKNHLTGTRDSEKILFLPVFFLLLLAFLCVLRASVVKISSLKGNHHDQSNSPT